MTKPWLLRWRVRVGWSRPVLVFSLRRRHFAAVCRNDLAKAARLYRERQAHIDAQRARMAAPAVREPWAGIAVLPIRPTVWVPVNEQDPVNEQGE